MTNLPSIESMEKRVLCAASTGDASALFNVSSLLEPTNAIHLSKIGDYATGVFDEGAAEIPVFDPISKRAFVVNGANDAIDVLDLSNPSSPTKVGELSIGSGSPNSVAVKDGIVAAAFQADDKTDPGVVAFFDSQTLALIDTVTVGAQPDMVTFTPNGQYVLTANEGEPSDDYSVDPEGSISIIKLTTLKEIGQVAAGHVRLAGFSSFNAHKATLLAQGVRIFGPGATVAQDIEPEYVAVSADSRTAFVTLQENNALAIVDIPSAKVLRIVPLGAKSYHSDPAQQLDPSDRDEAINIANWPVYGLYLPDAIAAFTGSDRQTYLITANEGDVREWGDFSEEARVKDLDLDPTAFPNADELQDNDLLGRLKVTNTLGDTDGDGDFDELYAFGGRSFSIWTTDGQLVFDSGSWIEQIVAEMLPDSFNASNDDNDFDSRSDDKGPEPEGVTIGVIDGRTYAFVGLERIGGVMVFDVTDPTAPTFVQYINPRDFSADVESAEAGDLGPEGLVFVPAEQSPTGKPLLLVGNEVGGTTAVFEIGALTDDSDATTSTATFSDSAIVSSLSELFGEDEDDTAVGTLLEDLVNSRS